MSTKQPAEQVAPAREAAALKAAKPKPPQPTRRVIEEQDVEARVQVEAEEKAEHSGQKKPLRILSKRQLLDKIPLTFPTIWARMRAGTFPRAVDYCGKTGWIEEEIDAWIKARPKRKFKGDGEVAS
jgi:predicted DNA-binding transcriptional regulator AlpA